MIFPPTDWLDFVATEYDVGAPATSLSFERWFRNPVAIAQGAAGAQRVVADASADSVAGPTLLFRSAKYDATTWGLVPGSLFRATTSCQVRVTAFRFAFSGAPSSVYYRITKNGTTVVSGTGSDASITADITLVAGDIVVVEGRADDTSSITIYAEYSTGDLRAVGGI